IKILCVLIVVCFCVSCSPKKRTEQPTKAAKEEKLAFPKDQGAPRVFKTKSYTITFPSIWCEVPKTLPIPPTLPYQEIVGAKPPVIKGWWIPDPNKDIWWGQCCVYQTRCKPGIDHAKLLEK